MYTYILVLLKHYVNIGITPWGRHENHSRNRKLEVGIKQEEVDVERTYKYVPMKMIDFISLTI